MKFYTQGDKNKPVILLIPGTCCHYSLFDKVLPLLQEKFQTVVVSFDGFDESENTTYKSMEEETIKIEEYIKNNFNNEIHAIYGCSLGGSFASFLVKRNNIKVKHIILGSSDLDHTNKFNAYIKGRIMTPILYKMIHTQKLPKVMIKKMEKLKKEDSTRYNQMNEFLKSFMVDSIKDKVSKTSIFNQYVSDLTTSIGNNIDNGYTKIHVFYALKMGEKYRKRYLKHFKNPDIREQNLNHETFFYCYPKEWVNEIFNCCF